MGNINLRIDDQLKKRAYVALEKLGITPSELLRQTLEYVAQSGKLPFKAVLLTDEDEALISIARERLKNPQSVSVSLHEL